MSFLETAAQQLAGHGIANPYREARSLLAYCLGTTYEEVFLNPPRILSSEHQNEFANLILRRLADEPLSKIKGVREFWGQPFSVTAATLDPRPDSETLIEAVLEHFADRNRELRILDLGTGSGCLLLSLLQEYPKAQGIGIDICEQALQVAFNNARALKHSDRCQFICSDWIEALSGNFDIIVSNPPYIAVGEDLPKAVSHYDPPKALFAGSDGLQAYKQLLPALKKLCHPAARLFLEIGSRQYEAVASLITHNSGHNIVGKMDLQGHLRVVSFEYINFVM